MLGIYVADLNADYIDMPFGRGGPATPGIPGANSRTKRMRTSFKHHQLRTMKSYFAINHNPDAKDLKQLSQKTGLPKRVLQVSFRSGDEAIAIIFVSCYIYSSLIVESSFATFDDSRDVSSLLARVSAFVLGRFVIDWQCSGWRFDAYWYCGIYNRFLGLKVAFFGVN